MAERYPKRKLSTEEISRALNLDSDDSNNKLEKLLGEDSGSDIEFTLNRPRKSYVSDSDSDTFSDSENLKRKRKNIVSLFCLQNLPRNQYMKERNHSNVKYLMISLSENIS